VVPFIRRKIPYYELLDEAALAPTALLMSTVLAEHLRQRVLTWDPQGIQSSRKNKDVVLDSER